jgi:hypothetical protein
MTKEDVGFSLWGGLDMQGMQDIDKIAANDGVNIVQDTNIKHHNHMISDVQSKHNKACTRLMSEMRATLQNIRWTETIPGLLHLVVDIRPPPPKIEQNGVAWKTVVAQKHAEVLQLQLQNMPANLNSMINPGATNNQFIPDDMHVVKKSYLSCFFMSKEWQATIEDISSHFSLNQEQCCAFHIVANHTCDLDSEQLKMYVGGMADTGKSQVLHAISEFFLQRKELYRLLILVPTGSTAALLGGSTYHSVLGINSDGDWLSNMQMSQIKSRLIGVQYIFLDEVSKLSCKDIYLISARLAHILNNLDIPFGGMNMIFIGDFAQLAPAIGGEYASLYSWSIGMNPTSLYDQQAAIGKALWHQVTTIVMLCQNMRQQTKSTEDAQFCKALSNMRYKACTSADIDFLRS